MSTSFALFGFYPLVQQSTCCPGFRLCSNRFWNVLRAKRASLRVILVLLSILLLITKNLFFILNEPLCFSVRLLSINRCSSLHRLWWRREGSCLLTRLYTEPEVSRFSVGEGKCGISGWELLETKFGPRDLGWAKTSMNPRAFRIALEDSLRGPEKQHNLKFNCISERSPCPTHILVIQKTSTILTSLHHLFASFFPGGSPRDFGSRTIKLRFTTTACKRLLLIMGNRNGGLIE